MLPETDARHMRPAVKELSKQPNIRAAGGSTDPNAVINWLKHGKIKMDGERIEAMTIPGEESMVVVCRAMTKFNAVYNDMSPQMAAFHGVATRWAETHQG
jgi:hypothetical protein